MASSISPSSGPNAFTRMERHTFSARIQKHPRRITDNALPFQPILSAVGGDRTEYRSFEQGFFVGKAPHILNGNTRNFAQCLVR